MPLTSQGTVASVMASARATLQEKRILRPLPIRWADLKDAEHGCFDQMRVLQFCDVTRRLRNLHFSLPTAFATTLATVNASVCVPFLVAL